MNQLRAVFKTFNYFSCIHWERLFITFNYMRLKTYITDLCCEPIRLPGESFDQTNENDTAVAEITLVPVSV